MARKKELKGAKLNKRQVRQVKRIVSGASEDKYKDTTFLQSISSTGYTQALNIPAPNGTVAGQQVNERVGDRIKLKKLEMRGTLLGADTSNTVRIIVWRWRNDSNATPVPSLSTLLEGAPTYSLISPYNWQSVKSGQIHIVYDRTFTLDDNGTDARYINKVRFGKKLGKKFMQFLPGSAIAGNDLLYVSVLSDSSAASHPGVGLYFRLHYEDA